MDLIHSLFVVSQTLIVLSAEAETSNGEVDLYDGSGSKQTRDQIALECPGKVIGEKVTSNGS